MLSKTSISGVCQNAFIAATLCCILFFGCEVRAAEILKTDDTALAGNILSFDGSTFQIETTNQAAGEPPVAVSIRDVARITYSSRAPEAPVSPKYTVYSVAGREAVHAAADPDPPPALLLLPWQLKLANGDRLTGTMDGWTEDRFALSLRQQHIDLAIPTASVSEIWRLSPELIQKAMELKTESKTEDVAYVLKDREIIAVKGTALGIEKESLNFLYQGQQRKINAERLLGVVLAPQKRSPATREAGSEAVSVRVQLTNGDRLSGRWTALKNALASLDTPWNQSVDIPITSIWQIEFGNDEIVCLSDLKPLKVEQTPYFDRVISWRADSSLDGGPLRLNDGQVYARGIAMHSRCVLQYELDGQFDRFRARLGFEPLPANAPRGRAAVRALLDDKPIFENSDLRSDESPRSLVLGVRGGKVLTLEVDFGQDQDVNDRVVWANARLFRPASQTPADK